MALSSGVRLGPYEILGLLGKGGMGEVYRARDTRLDRIVALKVLQSDLAATPDMRARFEREARTVSSLNHSNICALYDVGRHDGFEYLVMEYLEGETLAARIEKGALPVAQIMKIGIEIADALDRAHRQGLVHRDLKPGNIMLTRSGAKLLDFGLARKAEPSALATAADAPTMSLSLTMEGTILGTLPYMAPEYFEGRKPDARSDIWALGATLYEMATGKPAFEASKQTSLIAAIIGEEPSPMEALALPVPAALERTIRQCLAKDPDERWQSAGDFRRELQWIAENDSRSRPPEPSSRKGARVRTLAWPVTATFAALLALATGLKARHPPPPVYQKLTFREGAISAARFSADGHTVVYSAAWDGDSLRLYSMLTQSPEASPLRLPCARVLSVSSAGEMALALDATPSTGLFTGDATLAIASMAGGAAREILDNVSYADWAPDGKSLAAVHAVDGRTRIEFPIGRVLYEPRGGWVSHVRVSPRGDRLAFFEHPVLGDDHGSVALIDLAGKKRVLADGWDNEEGLAWSPKGDEVWFTADPGGKSRQLRAVSLSGTKRLVTGTTGQLILQDISSDGRVLLTSGSQKMGILCRAPGAARERDLSWLDWSKNENLTADGQKLLLCEMGEGIGVSYTLGIRTTDGSPVVRLGEGRALGLSPDGKWALAAHLPPQARLMLIPTGPGESRLLDPGPVSAFGLGRWFPDGRAIVFEGSEPNRGVRCYTQNVSGDLPRALTPEGTTLDFDSNPVSPDGRWVAARTRDGRDSLFSVQNGSPRGIPGTRSDDQLLGWAEDGRSLFVREGAATPLSAAMPARIVRLDVTDGRRERVLDVMPANSTGIVSVNSIAVAPNGQAYAYSYCRYLADLYMVQGLK